MSRYIDADKINKIIEEKLGIFDTTELKDMLDEFPTEDVAPVVHATMGFDDDGFVRCSACNKTIRYPLISFSDIEYCPRCGAKVEFESEEE